MSRHYQNRKIDELEALHVENARRKDILLALLHELSHRSTPRSRDLGASVKLSLESLAAEARIAPVQVASPSPPPPQTSIASQKTSTGTTPLEALGLSDRNCRSLRAYAATLEELLEKGPGNWPKLAITWNEIVTGLLAIKANRPDLANRIDQFIKPGGRANPKPVPAAPPAVQPPPPPKAPTPPPSSVELDWEPIAPRRTSSLPSAATDDLTRLDVPTQKPPDERHWALRKVATEGELPGLRDRMLADRLAPHSADESDLLHELLQAHPNWTQRRLLLELQAAGHSTRQLKSYGRIRKRAARVLEALPVYMVYGLRRPWSSPFLPWNLCIAFHRMGLHNWYDLRSYLTPRIDSYLRSPELRREFASFASFLYFSVNFPGVSNPAHDPPPLKRPLKGHYSASIQPANIGLARSAPLVAPERLFVPYVSHYLSGWGVWCASEMSPSVQEAFEEFAWQEEPIVFKWAVERFVQHFRLSQDVPWEAEIRSNLRESIRLRIAGSTVWRRGRGSITQIRVAAKGSRRRLNQVPLPELRLALDFLVGGHSDPVDEPVVVRLVELFYGQPREADDAERLWLDFAQAGGS